MNYTYKLARRLARMRPGMALFVAGAIGCTQGELVQPDTDAPAGPISELVALDVLPDSVTLETNQSIRLAAMGKSSKADSVAVEVEWTASGGTMTADGYFSAAAAGRYTVFGKRRRTYKSPVKDSSIVTVVPPQPGLHRVAITPDSVRLGSGQSTTFTAVGLLSDSTSVPVGVVWTSTGGAVNADGKYMAGQAPGTYWVVATNSSSRLADTATVIVQAAAPAPVAAELVLLPASADLQIGTQQQFAAYGRTTSGDSISVAVTYTASGGTITPAGVYTAGQTAGAGRVIAMEANGRADTALIAIITPPGPPAPAPPAGSPGDTTSPVIPNVEVMDALSAQHVRQGLGFQVEPSRLWEFQAAKDIGASEVRFQPSWDHVEKSPGARMIDARLAGAFAEAGRLGLDVQAVAAYGPGWTTPLTFTVASDVAAGQTNIPVTETGTLASVIPHRDHARRTDGNMLVANGRWSYAGAMLTGTSGNALVLGSPLATSLTVGQKINVNRRAYAPPVDATSTTDPSVLAYRDYVVFLASEMQKRGVKGHVEIWNEPPWNHDKWAGGRACFVSDQSGCQSAMKGMAALLATLDAPPGIGWNYGGPHKTGTLSVLWNGSTGGVKPRPGSDLTQESIHPYGDAPEWGGWNSQCLRAKPLSGAMTCNLVGQNPNSNQKMAVKMAWDHEKATGHRIGYVITETGILTTNREVQRRYFLRSFFHYLGAGIERVSFYRLSGDPVWSVVDVGTRALHPAANALKAMMADLTPLAAQAPSRVEARPAVTAYSGGQWPLHVVPVLGRAAGASRNTYWLVVWQRTHPASGWSAIPHPAGASVTVRVPAGYRVSGALELTTRSPISVTAGTETATVTGVRDEPVAIRVEP